MRSFYHFLTHPKDILIGLLGKTARFWPDKIFLEVSYFLRTGKRLDLSNPITFTEKLNWLKINDIHAEYSLLVDKYTAKTVVKDKLGNADIIIETLGVWSEPQDIDFDLLPNKFVLKTTNGGGNNNVVICEDKNLLSQEVIKHRLRLQGGAKLYDWSREYPYKNFKPKIIAEKLLENRTGDIPDYKFFCFNGKVKFLKIDTTRHISHHATYLYPNWELAPFRELELPSLDINNLPAPPSNLEEMIRIAEVLSDGIPFLRVDLYNIEGKIYFGEMTLFPAAGFGMFTPYEWEIKIGEYLQLPR
ncbi:MAG: hypothetical protein K2H01_02815 [Ruminococcus sp.]|nr:hypothetical protein [Ruminococcus sp.]